MYILLQIEGQLFQALKEIESLRSKLISLEAENSQLKSEVDKFRGDLKVKDDSIQQLKER